MIHTTAQIETQAETPAEMAAESRGQTRGETPVEQTHVYITCPDGFEMPALLLNQPMRGPAPAVLFIYEAFGMNSEMIRIASEVAASGYVVLMPDVLSRGSWFQCIRGLFRDLKAGTGPFVNDLLAAREWLAKRPDVADERVGVMGFCVGGGFALLLCRTGLFRVSAAFYGQAPSDLNGSCPIVASYGERDGVTKADAKRLEQMLEDSDVPHDFKIYPDAGHSFMNHGPNAFIRTLTRVLPANAGYRPEAAKDAMRRVVSFLGDHL